MSEKFIFEIITPERSILKIETSEVVLPSFEGEIGILRDHIPLITFLRPGIIKITDENKKLFVEEGTVEFINNNLLVLTSTVKDLSDLNRNFLETMIREAEKNISKDKITDKEKYLLSYKIDTLKNINQ
tara:strand:- start:233 stop:619 length:387 start_codon:yes stop_codon:yes gene_type:complete